MDTEDFLLERRNLLERLSDRRARDLSSSPVRMARALGIEFPAWAKVLLSLAPNAGVLSGLMRIGLPLALPFLFKRKAPFFTRLLAHFYQPKI